MLGILTEIRDELKKHNEIQSLGLLMVRQEIEKMSATLKAELDEIQNQGIKIRF
jgi:hypothetical protein